MKYVRSMRNQNKLKKSGRAFMIAALANWIYLSMTTKEGNQSINAL